MGRSTFDLHDLLNNKGAIVIVNMDFNKLGSQASDFIGRLFVAASRTVFSSRLNIPLEFRPNTTVYKDEAQRLVGSDIDVFMSEMGKCNVSLLIAHQHTGQFDEKNLKSIFANTYTKIAGANSLKNASVVAPEMRVTPEQLANVEKYTFQLNIDGKDKGVFRASDLVLDPSMYISEEEAREKVDKYMIKRYYKRIIKDDSDLVPDTYTLDEDALK